MKLCHSKQLNIERFGKRCCQMIPTKIQLVHIKNRQRWQKRKVLKSWQ